MEDASEDITEPLQIETDIITYAINIDLYQYAHARSLIKVYAVH